MTDDELCQKDYIRSRRRDLKRVLGHSQAYVARAHQLHNEKPDVATRFSLVRHIANTEVAAAFLDSLEKPLTGLNALKSKVTFVIKPGQG